MLKTILCLVAITTSVNALAQNPRMLDECQFEDKVLSFKPSKTLTEFMHKELPLTRGSIIYRVNSDNNQLMNPAMASVIKLSEGYRLIQLYNLDEEGKVVADSSYIKINEKLEHNRMEGTVTFNASLYQRKNVLEDWTSGNCTFLR